MLELPTKAMLWDCREGKRVAANLVTLDRGLAKEKIDPVWWADLGITREQRRAEADHHWNWTKIIGAKRSENWVERCAAQTPDGDVQGAMVYRLIGLSTLEVGAGCVFGEYFATAPRNREWLVKDPAFRGAGRALMTRAIAHSYLLGLDGRVSLFSLPSERTLEWYGRQGFTRTDVVADEMPLFELPKIAAHDWLRKEGLLP